MLLRTIPSPVQVFTEADGLLAYDQFEFVTDMLPVSEASVGRNIDRMTALGLMAAVGLAFPFSATAFGLLCVS